MMPLTDPPGRDPSVVFQEEATRRRGYCIHAIMHAQVWRKLRRRDRALYWLKQASFERAQLAVILKVIRDLGQELDPQHCTRKL